VHGSRPIDQAEAAARFIAAPEHEKMHDERLWDLRQKRDREMHGIAEWEELRGLASAIKERTLTHLDQYLEEFEANARANGVHVHWARDIFSPLWAWPFTPRTRSVRPTKCLLRWPTPSPTR
jgi:L-lactate dehydrogenase complex protein LldF